MAELSGGYQEHAPRFLTPQHLSTRVNIEHTGFAGGDLRRTARSLMSRGRPA